MVERVADRLSIPFTVGGGIRTAEDMRDILRAGADKVAVNTAAVEDPAILSNGARRFGRQSVVLAIDARRRGHGTIVGINGSMVNGTPVIRPARGEAPSIPPWDSADFPDRTARISGRTASSNRRPAWPDAGLRPDQASGRTSPRPTARRSHGQLIDVSGSMTSADRLPMLRSALALFVDSLGPEDKVSIVTYAGTSGVALPTTPARHRAVIQRAIAQLESGGSTNGAAGIETAYHMARQAFVRGGVNRVILATDGDFNVGVTGEDELLKLVEREKASGIFLSVLGVGTDNLNDAMMELVADRGNGHYPYLDSMQEARRVLLREASSTLEVVARDVRFQVEFNPAVVAAWKQIG